MIEGKTVSLLLNWYSETSFLHEMWRPLSDVIDEVIVVGGPYEFAATALEAMDLAIDEGEARSRLVKVFADSRLVFFEEEWISEDQKRIAGYKRASGDLVLVCDADEILVVDWDECARFVASDQSVASIDVINFATGERTFGSNYFDFEHTFPRKNIIFKRDRVSADQHINYLWLVGVEQDLESREPSFHLGSALMLHFTGPRNFDDHLTRVIFYQSLWHRNNSADSMRNYLNNISLYKSSPEAFLAKSLDGVGLTRSVIYRPAPSRALQSISGWDSLRDLASSYDRERIARLVPSDLWPRSSMYFIPAWWCGPGSVWTAPVLSGMESVSAVGVGVRGTVEEEAVVLTVNSAGVPVFTSAIGSIGSDLFLQVRYLQ